MVGGPWPEDKHPYSQFIHSLPPALQWDMGENRKDKARKLVDQIKTA